MGLFFKSRKRRSSGGGFAGLLIILAVLYYTGMLPKAWGYIKNAGNSCYSVMNSVGIGAQGVCGAINQMMSAIDRNLGSLGDGMKDWMGDAEQQFDEQWANSQTRMDLEQITREVDDAVDSFKRSSLISGQGTLDALMQTGPGGFKVGSGDANQLKGAMDSFAIGQQLIGSQPNVGAQWLQKGASMGAFGLPSQLSLGNAYAQGGDAHAALVYYHQAQQSLSTLRSANSPASQQLLSGMSVSPDQLQAQITAAIKQIQQVR